MTLSNLKILRLIVPGCIAYILLTPFAWHLANAEIIKKWWAIYTAGGALCLGFPYAVFKVRELLWESEQHNNVGENIRATILQLAPKNLTLSPEERREVENRAIGKLGGIFWEAIDSDQVLKAQKEQFYFNGLLYSTSFDILILGLPASFSYVAALMFTGNRIFGDCALVSITIVTVMVFGAIPFSRKSHLKLSKDQLQMLKDRQSKFVADRIENIVYAMRESRRS